MGSESGPGIAGTPSDAPVVSVVVPVFNEAGGLEAFFAQLVPVLDGLGERYEILCIDDGSADASWARLAALRQRHPAVLRALRLSRNFGKEAALTAGLRHAAGRAVIPIDADLQHPPELIPELIAKWREGFEVVYAARTSRETDGTLRRWFTRAFYWIFDHLSEVSIPDNAGDFRLLDRRVVDVLNGFPERSRFMKGIFAWVGFRQAAVPFLPASRQSGASGWSFRKLFRFAVTGITAFSTIPLIAWSYVGAGVAAVSLFFGALLILRTLIQGVDVPGYASVMVAILFFGGLQLLTLGIIGGYLGRVYQEVKGRPLYIVAETIGFAAPHAAPTPGGAPGVTDPPGPDGGATPPRRDA